MPIRLPRPLGMTLRVLRDSQPGHRFQRLHLWRREQHPSWLGRLSSFAGGGSLVVSGIVTYPIPGPPSTLLVVTGFALVAREWEQLACALDRLELRLRRRYSSRGRQR